jgi:hypothetical protein
MTIRRRKTKRSLPTLIREAWKLSDQLEAAANAASGRSARSKPKAIRRAIEHVLDALYFHETHKWEGKLTQILQALDPELARVATERGFSAAWDAFNHEKAEDVDALLREAGGA